MATYTVKPGDSWERIAKLVYDNPRMFEELMRANGGAYRLHPGMTLRLPAPRNNPFVSNQTATNLGMATNEQFKAGYNAQTDTYTPPPGAPGAPAVVTPGSPGVVGAAGSVPTSGNYAQTMAQLAQAGQAGNVNTAVNLSNPALGPGNKSYSPVHRASSYAAPGAAPAAASAPGGNVYRPPQASLLARSPYARAQAAGDVYGLTQMSGQGRPGPSPAQQVGRYLSSAVPAALAGAGQQISLAAQGLGLQRTGLGQGNQVLSSQRGAYLYGGAPQQNAAPTPGGPVQAGVPSPFSPANPGTGAGGPGTNNTPGVTPTNSGLLGPRQNPFTAQSYGRSVGGARGFGTVVGENPDGTVFTIPGAITAQEAQAAGMTPAELAASGFSQDPSTGIWAYDLSKGKPQSALSTAGANTGGAGGGGMWDLPPGYGSGYYYSTTGSGGGSRQAKAAAPQMLNWRVSSG